MKKRHSKKKTGSKGSGFGKKNQTGHQSPFAPLSKTKVPGAGSK